MAQPAWDEWFDSQSTLCTKIEELVNEACRGKSPGYRLAVHAAIIESVSERMRVDIDLSDSDAGEPDTHVDR